MLSTVFEPDGRMRLKTRLQDVKGRQLDVEFTDDGDFAIRSGARELALVDAFTLRKIKDLKQDAAQVFQTKPGRKPEGA